ncbi:MAG: type II secretion system minor pseudopilin GspK [Proteobacteria bacterium]|nr:type II secretion system minor pseudopilin GspK [Pseudomonadota bacterium]MCL2306972.1 type II secretion system minor pseudopilin GspK [Pseudomonadota bacterium]
MKNTSFHRGGALIIAMLVAALAAAVAVTLIVGEQRWLAGVEAQRDHAQAQALADAGVRMARHILFQEMHRGEAVVHLKESWAFPLPPTPFENGFVEGRIIDLQGRFNLNNLLPTSRTKRADLERLNRLCRQLELDGNTCQALFHHYLAGLDVDNPSSSTLTLPPLFDLGDLALPAAAMSKLAPHLTALPEPVSLNLNTAERDTLRAIFADIRDEDLNKILAERDSRPFFSLTDFRRRLPPDVRTFNEEGLGVNSRYFLITVRARQGDARAQAQALVRRDAKRWPEIVWKTVE